MKQDGDEQGKGVRPGAEGADDFLYHLYRGSTLLLQDQVVEAKEELERALALQPQDAKSQDLLAGVYFRLGVYPRAIEIWQRLVEAFPSEASLRVNLGLALFKTGQAEEAQSHIHEALRLQPDHERAWGYLGLILWRLGDVAAARDAFLRGGQASMARRMDAELKGKTTSGMPAPPDEEELAAKDHAAMRSAAEEAIERLEGEHPHLAVEASETRRRASGGWRPVEPGTEVVPPRLAPVAAGRAKAPPTLADQVSSWTLRLPPDLPLAVSAAGDLVVQSRGDVFLRLSGLAACRGELRTTAVNRRTRGKDLDELLGARDPIMHWRGPITALLRPAAGSRFFCVSLGSDALYVREEHLVGFDARVAFESASLPLAGAPVSLTQLHGDGIVVLQAPSEPVAMAVTDSEEVRVMPQQLLGWTGRLFPNTQRGTAPYSAHAPPLAFRGEGAVLLYEPKPGN